MITMGVGARHMQGVPAQKETLHKDPNEKRRYPTHCINCDGKARICSCPLAIFYMERCRSSKNCDYYEERQTEG